MRPYGSNKSKFYNIKSQVLIFLKFNLFLNRNSDCTLGRKDIIRYGALLRFKQLKVIIPVSRFTTKMYKMYIRIFHREEIDIK